MANPYVPVTITNSESSATPTDFQQYISIDMSPYSSVTNSELSNCYWSLDTAGSTVLDSWRETAASQTGTMVWWVNLGSNTIAANSTLTIYLQIPTTSQLNDTTTGEAPQLSSTYAKYDDGASVFNNYWNFAGTSLPSAFSSSDASPTVDNGITWKPTTAGTYGYTLTTATYSPPLIVEAYGTIPLNINYAEVGFSGTSSNIGTYVQSTGASTIVGLQYDGTVISSGTLATTTTTGIWTISAVSSTAANFYLNYGSEVSITADAPTYPLSIGFSGDEGNLENFYWLRTRAYPPNGVMPTTSAGSLVDPGINTTTSVEMVYEF
jgi:hypothetical protein